MLCEDLRFVVERDVAGYGQAGGDCRILKYFRSHKNTHLQDWMGQDEQTEALITSPHSLR
jgi:hypothetical protein